MQDMRLVWANCLQYNGKGSKYGKIGDRCSSTFEEMWASSGLDTGDRHRRTNAGHAATRYALLDFSIIHHHKTQQKHDTVVAEAFDGSLLA